MSDDLRRFNGGPRQGAGRPPTVRGYRQVAVRLPEDMARWVTRQSTVNCGGSDAGFIRQLIRAAMEGVPSEGGAQKE